MAPSLLYLKPLILLCLLCGSCSACTHSTLIERYSIPHTTKQRYQTSGLDLFAVYEIHNPEQVPWLYEISGLAWDHDEQELIAVTDTGYLLRFGIDFSENDLACINLLDHAALEDASGEVLRGIYQDSEGIALMNHNNGVKKDSEALVSFEREPRIIRYHLNGEYINSLPLPEALKNIKQYRGQNKQLEAITTVSGIEGHYVTAPERPLSSSNTADIDIFTADGKLTEIPLVDAEYGAIVGLTTLPNGDLMALERVFRHRFSALGFHLHHLSQEDDYQTVKQYSFDPSDALINDNFEGLTHVADNRFFMISDDNQNSFQRTLLIYFQLKDTL